MSEPKHTPGPWEVVNGCDVFSGLGATNRNGVACDSDDGWHIADCANGKTFIDGELVGDLEYSEQAANAKLISAAPDLLEALQAALEWIDNAAHGVESYEDEVMESGRAAIAKALGEA